LVLNSPGLIKTKPSPTDTLTNEPQSSETTSTPILTLSPSPVATDDEPPGVIGKPTDRGADQPAINPTPSGAGAVSSYPMEPQSELPQSWQALLVKYWYAIAAVGAVILLAGDRFIRRVRLKRWLASMNVVPTLSSAVNYGKLEQLQEAPALKLTARCDFGAVAALGDLPIRKEERTYD
jgi:hypothetical protein